MIGEQRLGLGPIIKGKEMTKKKKLLIKCGKNLEEINKRLSWDSK
jgi:hypothetical protein